MADTAIYFPYIDIPQSEWLSRVLLYWDSLLSIVPYEYMNSPEQHSSEMRDLLASGLVVPCIPGQYLGGNSRFAETFLSFVKKRNVEVRRTYRSRIQQPLRRVHIEKLGDIGDGLVEMGVARYVGHPWYELQPWVAEAFMAYLAAVLGKHPEINAAPVTHQRQSLALLTGRRPASHLRRVEVRDVLLNGVFPRPTLPPTLESLVTFKERHGQELRRLRRAVEEECIGIAEIGDDIHRQERASLVAERLEEQVETVAEAMRIKWGQVIFGGIFSALGAAGGLASIEKGETGLAVLAGSGLTSAVYTAVSSITDRNDALREPLAYAALLRTKFRP